MAKTLESKTLKGVVNRLEETMECNCNLNKWIPEKETGHSKVCRIHHAAIAEWYRGTSN